MNTTRQLSFLLICLVIGTNVIAEENLYKILGVSRQADTQEIKKAYKRLAREWHPDKNSDPSATEKFMKINEAYETLSNPQKKSDYDNYGTTAGQAQPGRHPHNDFDAFFHRAGGFQFDNFRFNFDRGDKNHINYRIFENTIVPESNTKPFLIYAYTDFCFQCMQVQPIWQQMIDDLEKIGMGVATMNANMDGALVRKLRLSSVPAVVGVVSGKLFWFSKPFNIQNLREFVRSIQPPNLITEVTESNAGEFLNSWKDNRVRVVMFDTRKQPCLRFLLSAFAFRERVSAGYVNTNTVSRNFFRKYKISVGQENILVFKEDVDNPAAQISMKSISRSTMDEVIESNKFLVLPRLSNQATFDYLCPVRSLARDRKLCILLLTRNIPSDDGYRNSFREFAHSHVQSDDRINFAYVYEDTQSDLVQTLTWGQGATNSTLNTRKVAVVWRKTESRLLFDHLSEGWYSSDQPITDQDRSRQRLSEMIDWCLQSGDVLSFRVDLSQELYNEHQEAFIVRILTSIYNWKDILWEKFVSMDEMMMITMVCTALMVMFLGLMFGGIASTSERGSSYSNRSRRGRGQSSTQPSTNQLSQQSSIDVHPLTEQSYNSLIVNATPGRLLILVLVESDSHAKLIKQFATVAYPYSRGGVSMKFSYVSLDLHLLWYRRLLESTSGLVSQDFSERTGRGCAGSVLAINGSKNYYCLYDSSTSRSQRSTGDAGFLGLDDDERDDITDDDVLKYDPLYVRELEVWFEKLSEGLLPRRKLTRWPKF